MRELIGAIEKFYVGLDVAISKTQCCQSIEELWMQNGVCYRGYTYAAGQLHFAKMEQYEAIDLSVANESEKTTIRMDGFEKVFARA